ncbi:short coiled-coil protein isoform X1 [Bufo bufo]|uniref:short coiled-coil protein isoform X1 n=2 Tax=Bufo TaxID=8383 RepID=UPI001ABEDF2C|nr:short coiled-coil protein isoform X1 [Bufo bufo]
MGTSVRWGARLASSALCRRGGSRGVDSCVCVYIRRGSGQRPARVEFSSSQLQLTPQDLPSAMMNSDMDVLEVENQVELEEKTRLINQVLELQHTLEDLSARVDAVKEENLKLKSENQVLGQYIENLMSASSVFQTTDTKSKRK